jgi:transposase
VPGGRPTKLTPETQEKIVRAVRAGNYLETAAAHAGVRKQTLHDWLHRGANARTGIYREFSDAIQKALADAETSEVALITKAASDGAWQAAAWKLERRNPKRWGARVRVSVEEELNAALDKLAERLPAGTYEQVLAALADAGGSEASGENDDS